MAEYKALAQNTYKFVKEVVLQFGGDMSSPTVASLAKIKAIKNGELCYLFMLPWGGSSSYTRIAEPTSSHTISYSMRIASCIVDGKKYYGISAGEYGLWNFAKISGTVIVPAFRLKAVIYRADAESIEVIDTPVSGYTFNGDTSATKNLTLQIAKAVDDIIISMSIEYPKYDVTLSGTGIQYSLDDGVTFQDVTNGLVLEQVEHVIFKNTDTVTHNIGTTYGGTDVAALASGATYAAVPTADGAWYIS